MNVPPKLNNFLWRVCHNSLPVAVSLRRRGCNIERYCQLCGEEEESLNHMMFQCRISREIWELANFLPHPGDYLRSDSLLQNITAHILNTSITSENKALFMFIGWRILKMRNSLLFENKRKPLPLVLNKALSDYKMWKESQVRHEEEHKRMC